MGRGRRGGIQDLVKGFADTYGAFDRMRQVSEDRKLKDELKTQADNGGATTERAVSGEDALQAGMDARDQALAGAQTPEDQAAVNANFEPTISALSQDSQLSKPASVVASMGTGTNFQQRADKPFSPEDVTLNNMAAREGIYRKYGKDQEADQLQAQAQNRQLSGIQINEAKRQDAIRQSVADVDKSTSDFMKNRQQYGPDGQPIPFTDEDFVMAGKNRVMALAGKGLYEQAQQAAQEAMKHGLNKIQFEAAERKVDVDKAIAEIGRGNYAAGLAVYNKYMPDGSTATNVTKNKDGSITVDRVSSLNGEKLSSGKYKDEQAMIAGIQALTDSNALAANLERTFQHDIESRKTKAEETKAGAAVASAGAAVTSAAATAGLHTEQTLDAKTKRIGYAALGKLQQDPKAVLTDEERAAANSMMGQVQASRNTPEAQNTALGKLDEAAKSYLKLGDTPLTALDQKTVDKRQAIYLRTMALGKAAIQNSRIIDPAEILKQAEDDYKRQTVIGGGTGTSGPAVVPGAKASQSGKTNYGSLWGS